MNKRLFLVFIILLVISLSACIQVPEIVQVSVTPAPPTATPFIVQATPTLPAPTATATPAPPTEASPQDNTLQPESVARSAEPAPALIEIAMFDTQNGWGRSEESFYQTGDGWQTWQSIALPAGGEFTTYTAVYTDAQSAYIVSTDPERAPSLLHITKDGGQTWQQIELPGQYPSFPSPIIVNPQTIFIFENLGGAAGSQAIALSLSLDSGQTWVQTFAHVPGETENASLPFGGQKSLPIFLNAELGFIGGSRPMENDIYFFRTQDSGQTWQPQPLPVPENIRNYMAMVQTPLLFASEDSEIIVPVNFSLLDSDPLLVFFHSKDSGQNWQATAPIAYGSAYAFLDTQTGWAWAENNLYATRDGGQTWQNIQHNLPKGASVNQLQFTSPQNGWALVFELDFQTRLYVTNDGGQTWQTASP